MAGKLLLTCARVAAAALAVGAVAADATCYYPDGKEADQAEQPCSTADASACCPQNWECLDNGLCHYAPDNLWGTYSCTDQSWQAAACPSNLCTYNLTRVGAEAMSQCGSHDNDWCCNGDAVHVNCCAESPAPRPFFPLADGKAYATIGTSTANSAPTLSSITGLASGSGSATASGEAVSSTPASGSSLAQSSGQGSSKTAAPITSQFTSVSSGTAGLITVVVTSVIQPVSTSGTAASPPSSSSNNHIGVIVGCAVGIPLALALAGILIWLCHKRRNQKANPYDAPPDVYGDNSTLNSSPDFAGGAKLQKPGKEKSTVYKNEMPGVPELPGQSVGPERPISHIPGHAELQSGGAFVPGTTPHAPHLVGVGGGTGNTPPTSSWGSAPPGYSPGQNQYPSQGPHEDAVEADGAAVPGHPPNMTEGGRYIPYRPPQGHATAAGGHQLQDVPEMAEMSAVKTPPA